MQMTQVLGPIIYALFANSFEKLRSISLKFKGWGGKFPLIVKLARFPPKIATRFAIVRNRKICLIVHRFMEKDEVARYTRTDAALCD